MARKGTGAYPPGWPEFARSVKDEAGWCCIRCGHAHDPAAGYCLTVHHATMAKDEPFEHWWAFLALCQRCHLQIQHKVILERPWVMQEHTAWFRPYAAGYYGWKYLGLHLDRPTVERHQVWLLAIEADVTLHGARLDDLRYEWAFRTM